MTVQESRETSHNPIESYLYGQFEKWNPTREAVPQLTPLFGLPASFPIAHRMSGKFVTGQFRVAPENTIPAMEAAALFGYRLVEIDITANIFAAEPPALFVIHSNDPLQRMTNGTGSPFDKTWDYLSSLDAGKHQSSIFTGVKIPSFRELKLAGNKWGIQTLDEIKYPFVPGKIEDQNPEVSRAIARLVVQEKLTLARDHNIPLSPILSFSEAVLKEVADTAPNIPLVRNIAYKEKDQFTKENWPQWEERLHGINCMAIDPDQRLLTESFVRRIQASGFTVLSYFTNSQKNPIPHEVDRIRKVMHWGVYPITDLIHQIKPTTPQDIPLQ